MSFASEDLFPVRTVSKYRGPSAAPGISEAGSIGDQLYFLHSSLVLNSVQRSSCGSSAQTHFETFFNFLVYLFSFSFHNEGQGESQHTMATTKKATKKAAVKKAAVKKAAPKKAAAKAPAKKAPAKKAAAKKATKKA